MTIAFNSIGHKEIKDGFKYITLDGIKYKIEDIPPTSIIPPASFWRKFIGVKEVNKSNTESYSVVTEAIIRDFIKPRYVSHFLLGDLEADVADLDVLTRQAKKHGVASIPYSFPKYDCEDRSFACMGAWHLNAVTAAMATYIIWVTYVEDGDAKAHALNGLCTSNNFYLYEPAQYRAFAVPDFWMINVLMG